MSKKRTHSPRGCDSSRRASTAFARPPRSCSFGSDTRGVQYTIGVVILLGLTFGALMMTVQSAPSNAEEQAQRISNYQLRQDVADLLEISRSVGDLKESTLYYDGSSGSEHWVGSSGGADDDWYTTLQTEPPHPLFSGADHILHAQDLSYNIVVQYQHTNGSLMTKRLVYQGTPGLNAVRSSREVLLRDDDQIEIGSSTDGDSCTLGEIDTDSNGCDDVAFYAPDISPSSSQYNLVNIRFTVWSL